MVIEVVSLAESLFTRETQTEAGRAGRMQSLLDRIGTPTLDSTAQVPTNRAMAGAIPAPMICQDFSWDKLNQQEFIN